MKTNRFLMIVLMFLVFGIGIFILTEIQNSTSVGLLELNNIVFNNVNKNNFVKNSNNAGATLIQQNAIKKALNNNNKLTLNEVAKIQNLNN
jgi:hypothetical protein